MAADTLQRFLFDGRPVCGEITRLDETFARICGRHDYPRRPSVYWANRALLSATLKFDDTLPNSVEARRVAFATAARFGFI